jgi:hypothetical protein
MKQMSSPSSSSSLSKGKASFPRLSTAHYLRRAALGTCAIAVVGTTAELLLTGHYKELAQWPPLILLGLTALGLVTLTIKPTPTTLSLFRYLMLVVLLSSLAGVFFHLKGNIEFKLETKPGLSGLALYWQALKGGLPVLAPGIMVQIGLLGLMLTFHHPDDTWLD